MSEIKDNEYTLVKETQKVGKELLMSSKILETIINSDVKSNNEYDAQKLEKKIKVKKYIAELEMNMIIRRILNSKKTKMKKKINNLEEQLLIEDIIESFRCLDFHKDEDISNFILAYIDKFIE